MAFLSQAKHKLASLFGARHGAAGEAEPVGASEPGESAGSAPAGEPVAVDSALLQRLAETPVDQLNADVLGGATPQSLLAIGSQFFSGGDLDRSEIIYRYLHDGGEIPEAEYHNLLSMLGLMRNDLASAVSSVQTALEQSGYADRDILVNGVNVFLFANQFDRSIDCLQKLYALGEFWPELTCRVVDVLHLTEDYQKSATLLEQYLDQCDDLDVGICLRAATAYAELQDYSEAEYFLNALVEKELEKNERIAVGSLYFRIRKEKYGRPVFEQLLEQWPDDEVVLIDYGTNLFRRGYTLDALEVLSRCIEVHPQSAVAYQNYGVCLRENGQLTKANEALRKAERFWDQDFIVQDRGLSKNDLMLNLCIVASDLSPSEEQLAILDDIVRQEPHNEKAIWHRAILRLATGHYQQGWHDYQLRWKSEDVIRRPFAFPRWQGEPLAPTDRLLVYAEQGVGDEIMFASCLGDLRAHCPQGDILVECDARLISLYQQSFEGFEYVGRLKPGEEVEGYRQFDGVSWQLPIGDLPYWFRRERDSFQSVTPFLQPSRERLELWREKLSGLGEGRKIGLSWRGGTKVTRKILRSIPTDILGEFLRAHSDYTWVSLQYGDVAEDLEQLQSEYGVQVHHLAEMNDDFEHLAALALNLDAVVSVQTALVHLCGAVDVPVHCMLPQFPEWRYRMVENGRSVWYPSVKLYRQLDENSWPTILDGVGKELTELFGSENA